jgi:hypothetical protein
MSVGWILLICAGTSFFLAVCVSFILGAEVGGRVKKTPPCRGNIVGISEGWMLLVNRSWPSFKVGDDVGADVCAVGLLVGLGWVGLLVGLDDVGRRVVGLFVGLIEMIALVLLDDCS